MKVMKVMGNRRSGPAVAKPIDRTAMRFKPGTLAAKRVTRKAMHIFSTGSPIEPAFTSCPNSKRVCAIVTSY